MIYHTEKQLKEFESKIPAEVKVSSEASYPFQKLPD